MGGSPKFPDPQPIPSTPTPIDDNILRARERAKRRALAAFGISAATLTQPGMRPKSNQGPTLAGSISNPTNRG